MEKPDQRKVKEILAVMRTAFPEFKTAILFWKSGKHCDLVELHGENPNEAMQVIKKIHSVTDQNVTAAKIHSN